jgi:dihydroneopterin aldolase
LDSLHIKGLTVATRIGVYAWEQQIEQRLLIDITIPADFSACDDLLAKTVDYDKLCQQVTTYVESNAFQLIETVADRIAHLIKTEFKVEQLSVSVSKPHAIKNAANIQVTVTR